MAGSASSWWWLGSVVSGSTAGALAWGSFGVRSGVGTLVLLLAVVAAGCAAVAMRVGRRER